MNVLARAFQLACTALIVALALPAASPAPNFPGVTKPSGATPAPVQEKEAVDPLGRTTPRRTIVAFIRAVDRDDFVAAERYLQLKGSQRANAETLARDLKELMDRHLTQPVGSISDAPGGALDDGLPIDRERVGPFVIGDNKAYITLVRVNDPQAGQIWLISSETLAQVPSLSRAVSPNWVERTMPAPLQDDQLLGISWAHWIVLAASLLVPLLLLATASAVTIRLARSLVRAPERRRLLDAWYGALRWPVVIVLTLAIHLGSMVNLGFPVTFRYAYGRVGLAITVLALAWLLRRVLTLGFARARSIAWGKDPASAQSLMRLGQRVLNALVILGALFAILSIAGVDTGTALAGLGIGGVALALGAQRTVENFLGGVFLLSDKAIAVGDFCNISDRRGWVEDITLRSVRLRTLEQTLVSIPAGTLAQAGIENFATREKILAQTTLRLRHGTSVDQLRRILHGIRTLLDEDRRFEPGSRIRLMDFGQTAIELELFAYVLTADFAEFLSVREELLLKIAAIVEAAGSGFAQPTQFVHLEGPAAPIPPAPVRAVAGSRNEARFAEPSAEATTQVRR